jgi:predicted nucleic acid-binding protein
VVQGNLAELEFAEDRPERALERVAEAIVVFRDMRATIREATSLVNSAAYLIALRRVGESHREASRALYLGRRAHDAQIVAVAVQHLATVAALDGDVERGARLIGYVDAWYRNEGYEREHNERVSREVLAATLRESLSQNDIARLNTLGASLDEEEAAREADVSAPASVYGRL